MHTFSKRLIIDEKTNLFIADTHCPGGGGGWFSNAVVLPPSAHHHYHQHRQPLAECTVSTRQNKRFHGGKIQDMHKFDSRYIEPFKNGLLSAAADWSPIHRSKVWGKKNYSSKVGGFLWSFAKVNFHFLSAGHHRRRRGHHFSVASFRFFSWWSCSN